MALHFPSCDDIRELGHIGLAIKHTGEGRFHIGALYRDEHSNVRFLHLAFHHDLRYEAAPRGYSWCDLDGFDKHLAQLAINTFRQIWEVYGPKTVPYSFLNDTIIPEELRTGDYDAPGSGFTCATFVLRVLERVGIRFIDEDTWQQRPDDQAWRDYIVALLREHFGSSVEQHITRMLAEPTQFRIHPLDLVIALQLDGLVTFNQIVERTPDLSARLMGAN